MHPAQINTWKRESLSKAASLFSDKNDNESKQKEVDSEKLYAHIGQLQFL